MTHEPLVELGRYLQAQRYAFVAVTPETHRRFFANAKRAGRFRARTLRDLLGWNLPIREGDVPRSVIALLESAGAVHEHEGERYASVRFATLDGRLFAHGKYPTRDAGAVFFGPDTYRFASLIARHARHAQRVVDVGCGSGAGGILAGAFANEVVLADINDDALALARVNATLAGLSRIQIRKSDVLASIDGDIDLVISNPPYLVDEASRAYRHGGGTFGADLSLQIARQALTRLAPGGQLVLYTGSAILGGVDTFKRDVVPILAEQHASFSYSEIDPDVFGEELDTPAYEAVDRIAAVALVATTRG